MPPERKRPGLTGAECMVTQLAIKSLLAKSRQDQALNTEEAEEDEPTFLEKLEAITQWLQSKVDVDPPHESYEFSSMADDHLTKLRISLDGFLELKTDLASHLAKNDTLGADGLWSADMLYRHLQYLEGLNAAAARLWINAFFYRVASMTPNGKKMVLSVAQNIPSAILSDESPPVSGIIHHWAAIATSPLQAKAKGPDQRLKSHVPQAVCEMYRCARTVGKTRIRGVLTNGRGWIFLVLTLNSDGGGTYLQSDEVSPHDLHADTAVLSRVSVSVVSSIIADWMTHSHEDLGADDAYFTPRVY
ncbi:hypothetical protein C8Q74DRAFT_1364988 [Fomes fomentarius]|nr:hypothetical protein C8Q74DRAFT_1364988 [Fomes fomentarius]